MVFSIITFQRSSPLNDSSQLVRHYSNGSSSVYDALERHALDRTGESITFNDDRNDSHPICSSSNNGNEGSIDQNSGYKTVKSIPLHQSPISESSSATFCASRLLNNKKLLSFYSQEHQLQSLSSQSSINCSLSSTSPTPTTTSLCSSQRSSSPFSLISSNLSQVQTCISTIPNSDNERVNKVKLSTSSFSNSTINTTECNSTTTTPTLTTVNTNISSNTTVANNTTANRHNFISFDDPSFWEDVEDTLPSINVTSEAVSQFTDGMRTATEFLRLPNAVSFLSEECYSMAVTYIVNYCTYSGYDIVVTAFEFQPVSYNSKRAS